MSVRRRSVLIGPLLLILGNSALAGARRSLLDMGDIAAIGGVRPGATGGDSLHSGYVLSWGEDFRVLDIVTPSNPRGKYFTTRAYGVGPRGSDGGVLGTQYDTDPYHTGYLDQGRGLPKGFNAMVHAGSTASLQARVATAAEITAMSPSSTVGGRKQISSMIHTGGACVFYPTADGNIVDFRVRYSHKLGNPDGMHFTLWVSSATPTLANDTDEYDFESNSQGAYFQRNVFTGGSNVSSGAAGVVDIFDGQWHTVSLVLQNGANCELWIDGILTKTIAADANTKSKPQMILITAHIYDGTFQGEAYSEAAWAADPDGARMDIDWVRVWRKPAAAHYKPLADIADLNLPYTGSGSIVLPSAAALWGDAGVTEYVQIIPHEAGDPGVSASTTITQFPSTVTYDSGTRTISADFSAGIGNTGRLHGTVYGYKADGSTCEPARFTINRGPKVSASFGTVTVGVAYSYDLYAACECGSILPKTIVVSGLPAGLSFSSATGLVTGTPSAAGASTVEITVTNSVGQSVVANVAMTVGPAYSVWTGPGWFDASDASIWALSGSQVTAATNKRSGGGNLTAAGTATNLTRVAGAQNGLAAIRVVRDVSTQLSLPRLLASASDTISTMCQGSDKPYTVIIAFKPTDTNTGFIWSWGDTVDNTDSQNIALVRRNATASSVRRQLVTASANDVSWGSGMASGTPRIVAVKHTGTAVTVWDNSATTKAVSGSAQDVGAFNAECSFKLFAAEVAHVVDPNYAQTQCNLDLYEIVIEDSAKSDADIQQAITDLASKWGITVS